MWKPAGFGRPGNVVVEVIGSALVVVGVALGEILFFSTLSGDFLTSDEVLLAAEDSFFSGVRRFSAEFVLLSGRPIVSQVLASSARGFLPSEELVGGASVMY